MVPLLLLWQASIPLSLTLIYFFSKKSKTILLLTVLGWLLWTFFMFPKFYQFINIIFSYFLITYIDRKFLKKDIDLASAQKKNRELEQIIINIDEKYNLRIRDLIKKNKRVIKMIYDHETHLKTLDDALSNSNNRIIILSGWVTDRVIDKKFKTLVLDSLKQGVTIYIGYGYKTKNEKQFTRTEQKNALKTLENLKEWSSEHKPEGRLHIFNYPNHRKLLISDSKYMICGSFNWLSNSGHSENQEISVGIMDKKTIDETADKIINFFNDLPPTRRSFLKRFKLNFSDY